MEEKEKDELQELRDLLAQEKARADENEKALKAEKAARVEDAKKYVFGTTTETETETDEDDDGVNAAAQRIAERLNAKYNKKNKTKGA